MFDKIESSRQPYTKVDVRDCGICLLGKRKREGANINIPDKHKTQDRKDDHKLRFIPRETVTIEEWE